MQLLLALLLPFSVFFTIDRTFSGLFFLLRQITLIDWISAAIWAVCALNQHQPGRKSKKPWAIAKPRHFQLQRPLPLCLSRATSRWQSRLLASA